MSLLRASYLPVTSCSRDGPSPMHRQHMQEYGLCCWGRVEEGRVRSSQQRGKENKVRGGQGILGNHKHRMEWSPRGVIPPIWPTAPDISSSCSGCTMAPNACLLLLPCCLSAFPLQLLKPQMPNLLCSSWEPLLHADTLILLEKVCTI